MHIHTIEHVPFEGPAALEMWAVAHGHGLTRTPIYDGTPPPKPDTIDLLAVLGGPMSVHDEQTHPWLIMEKEYLRKAVNSGTRILGICLGAQLLSEILGGTITQNPETEIGWLPVERTPEGESSPLFTDLPTTFEAFHWHGDTFSVPPGGIHLARSRACANQAFGYGRNILGVQFHLETTPTSMGLLIENCSDEIKDMPFVQSAERMYAQTNKCTQIHPTLNCMLNNLTKE